MTVTKHQCNGVDSVAPGTFSVDLPIPTPHNLVGFSSIHFSPLSLCIYPMPLLPGPFPLSPGPGNLPGISVFLALLVTFSSSSQDCMPLIFLYYPGDLPPVPEVLWKAIIIIRASVRPFRGPCHSPPSNALGDENSIIHDHGGGEQK